MDAESIGDDTVHLLSRFGALHVQIHNKLIVLGGIGCDGTIGGDSDIVLFSTAGSRIQALRRLNLPSSSVLSQIPRPLLVGSSVVLDKDNRIVIISGAATCFSMGTFCMSNPIFLVCQNTQQMREDCC